MICDHIIDSRSDYDEKIRLISYRLDVDDRERKLAPIFFAPLGQQSENFTVFSHIVAMIIHTNS